MSHIHGFNSFSTPNNKYINKQTNNKNKNIILFHNRPTHIFARIFIIHRTRTRSTWSTIHVHAFSLPTQRYHHHHFLPTISLFLSHSPSLTKRKLMELNKVEVIIYSINKATLNYIFIMYCLYRIDQDAVEQNRRTIIIIKLIAAISNSRRKRG